MPQLPPSARAWILAVLVVAVGPVRAEEPVTCDGGAKPGETRCGEGDWAGYRIECQPDGNWAQVGDAPDPACAADSDSDDGEGEGEGEGDGEDAADDPDAATDDGEPSEDAATDDGEPSDDEDTDPEPEPEGSEDAGESDASEG